MNPAYNQLLSTELNVRPEQVAAVATLLQEDATVPFIARYRKEATGSLDEVAIATIRDRLQQLSELDKRRAAILGSLEERSLLTPELRAGITAAADLTTLEDLYLPYRPKRRTRATIAREKGLEPLAHLLLQQTHDEVDTAALPFVSPEKGVASVEDALAGARDIIAETISETPLARAKLRELFLRHAVLTSRLSKADKAEAGAKFRDYFEWSEPIARVPSHRLLAMFRGEAEEFLVLNIAPDEIQALSLLDSLFVKGTGASSRQVALAVKEAYKRLLAPSMDTETRNHYKQVADEKAIQVFADNLRELLLKSPLGQKTVLAIDPGFRTGCKIVVLDAQGKLLHNDLIYLHGQHQAKEAEDKLRKLVGQYTVEAIAVGNGTAGRETEAFVRGAGLPASIPVVMVNESGASIYSASEVAREEFPDQDLTVRGAVSIGRRLMDPLAELVKIDARSIGVGQYQHDVDQAALKRGLDDVVTSCVNRVGVEVNTASPQLLEYVSGLGPQLAGNIVRHRNEHGPFGSRAALRKVPRLGPKAFEQCAGFLRVRNSKDPLDASAVHPESYPVVQQMAKDLSCTVADLMRDADLRKRIDLSRYVTEKVGMPTLRDILAELEKPGRDPREQFQAFSFAEGVSKIEDLQPGMKLPGIVTNVTAFGAFVDIGVHQDGLVHISQLADQFVKDPGEVVKVQQHVMVTVTEVDVPRKRIALSMKSGTPAAAKPRGAAPAPQDRPGKQERPVAKQATPPPRQTRPAENNWFADALNRAKK